MGGKALGNRLSRREELSFSGLEEGEFGIAIIRNGIVTFANSAAEKTAGRRMVGRIFSEIFPRHSESQGNSGSPCTYKLKLTKEGESVFIEVNTIPIKSKKPAMLVILRDITEGKKFEEEFFRRQEELITMTYELEQSNYFKDLFFDLMHHDLQNPIGIIQNYAELLLLEEGDQEKRVFLEEVMGAASRAIRLIDDATKLSKLSSTNELEMEEFDLAQIIGDAVKGMEALAEKAEMRIENLVAQSPPVMVNQIIGEVFANLISNAIKYAREGGRVVIDKEERMEFLRVKVVDFGKGVPDKYKQGIFDRFKKRKKKGVKGSGLGLAVSKKIVELHGGRIWVEDTPGGGATFVVELPRQKK